MTAPDLQSVERRDGDIQLASRIQALLAGQGQDIFVLTGSYSIDALTGDTVSHNDVDTNIFTPDIPRSIARTGLLLSDVQTIKPSKVTDTRLEYTYTGRTHESQLELQFIEYDDVEGGLGEQRFVLPSEGDHHAVWVPVVQKMLTTSSGVGHEFMVKSLPYAIATWALRISGAVTAQKRPVRQSDIDHFAFLLRAPHNVSKVIEAMDHHPQMPPGQNAADILSASKTYLKGEYERK